MNKNNLSYLLLAALFFSSCTNQSQNEEDIIEVSETPVISPTNYKEFIGNDFLVDNQHSYLGFKIKYFGFSPVRGRFDSFNGTLFYDENNLASLSVSIIINVSSINTGNDRRDRDLKRGGTWFDEKSYPVIVFKSKNVLLNADGSFNLIGDITIRGITKTDTINFSKPTKLSKDWAGNDQVDFSGRFTLNRQDYNVTGDDFWSSVMENGLTQLSDDVEIELDMHCRKADYLVRYADSDNTDNRKIVLDRIKFNGINDGLNLIDSLYQKDEVGRGMMSTIGYTLSAWEEYTGAKKVFIHKKDLLGADSNTLNQLGITELHLNNLPGGKEYFIKTLEVDSTNSRAIEYQRLIANLNKD